MPLISELGNILYDVLKKITNIVSLLGELNSFFLKEITKVGIQI